MKRLRTLLGIGLGLAVVAGAGWYITTHSSSSTASSSRQGGRFGANAPIPVGLAAAAKSDIPIVIRALGTVTPLATVTVKAQITGQLTQVEFTEGQSVKQGDLLAVVDPRPYVVALQQAQGTLEKDQALLKNAQIDLQRYKTLVAQDSIARQQYDTQAALVRQYEATIVTDQALVDNAKLNLVYTRIIAPVSGRIGLRLVDQGNYVTLGDATGICIITQMQPMTVIFTIPEDFLPQVRKRLRAGATLQTTALDRAQKTELATGKVSTHDNQIDTTTGTVKLRAEFPNTNLALFPNQFVNVRMLVQTLTDATLVPSAAIQRGAPGTFVYIVKNDQTVSVSPVKLGPVQGETTAITSGVSPGDVVVVDGADKLKEGAKVELTTREGQAAPAAKGRQQRGDRSPGAPHSQANGQGQSGAPPKGNGQAPPGAPAKGDGQPAAKQGGG
jgi:membrane fusion protein, multidrug efflux system